DEFPKLPEEDSVEEVSITANILNDAIANTLFATSNDDMRLSMTGVFVQVDFNKIIFVATDAHKLVKYTFGGITSENTASFIVPKKSLTLLKNALSSEGDVKMSFNSNNVFFSFDETRVICRLVDAKYPDYNAVIPVENPNVVTLGRKELQNSLRRIAIYANKTTNQVILNINENSLTISAQDLDFSNEATEQLACTYNSDPMTIGFNAKFMGEMLGILESDDVTLNLSTPNRAGILLPASQKDNEELLMLVMPVLMSN
ncbi:MAG: DNA polymerase III subunit beta, partial [Saprospiraceae bacterium]